MDKDYDGKITAEEFIKVFLEAEDILKSKIENSKKFLEDYHRQRKESANKLDEMRRSERLNAFGIMEGSTLSVTVHEARDLKALDWGSSLDPYVMLTCGENKAQTQVAHSLNPTWNELFTL
jgi:hypothetical protein